MVVDPIQSVKGKVVIDAFRSINPQTIMLGQEPRQTTSNLGHLNKPSIQVMVHIVKHVFFLKLEQYQRMSLILTFGYYYAGLDSWIEQTLLLNSHQLQEERARGEDVTKPPQEEMDRWPDAKTL